MEQNDISKEEKVDYFKTIARIALIFFIGFSIFLVISTIILIVLTKSDKEVSVPDVEGKKFVEVYNNLTRKGLKPELKFEDMFNVYDGIILEQHPESNSIVSENSTIKLTISRSSVYIDVPNLVGVELPMALNKIKNLHYHDRTVSLTTGIISYIPSDKSANNIVLDQTPRAGEKITPDRFVNLLVSTGKVETDSKMPSITGQSIDLCFDLLMAKGLVIREEVVKANDMKKSGLVIAQTPVKDINIKKNDAVTLKVNWYPLEKHPYSAYEKVEFKIPGDGEAGLYEAIIEDNKSKRIRFSRKMKAGQKIVFVFRRVGNAKIHMTCNKETVQIRSIDID